MSGPIQTGSIDVDLDTPSRSRVDLVISSSELKVSAAGEPEGDAPKVQDVMESEKVLDVRRHPKITYESRSVTLKSRRGNLLELSIAGQLTIRDVTQPVTVPVRVELGRLYRSRASGVRQLHATGDGDQTDERGDARRAQHLSHCLRSGSARGDFPKAGEGANIGGFRVAGCAIR